MHRRDAGDPNLTLTTFPRDTTAVYSAPGMAPGLRDHGGRTKRSPPLETQPCWILAPSSQAQGPPLPRVCLAPGRPLTQQQLPQGLLRGLPAAGPELALGITDLEASLLPDGGGGGTWGKPKSPQVVASSVGGVVVGAWGCRGRA